MCVRWQMQKCYPAVALSNRGCSPACIHVHPLPVQLFRPMLVSRYAVHDWTACYGAQDVLRKLLEVGVVSEVGDELQWTIRMLLPSPGSGALTEFNGSCVEGERALERKFYGPVVPQPQQASAPPAPRVGPTATDAGTWQSAMSVPLAAAPALFFGRYPLQLPKIDYHQPVGQSTALKQHSADEQQQQQQQCSSSVDLPLDGQQRTASCASRQGTPQQGSSNDRGTSIQPAAEAAVHTLPAPEAAVHTLRLLLASVPPTKLHSALASVLTQVSLPSCLPPACAGNRGMCCSNT